MFIFTFLVGGLLLWGWSTVAFDVVHWMLHKFEVSRFGPLRWLGGLHRAHHDFLDEDLKLHQTKSRDNIVQHLVPELLIRMLVTTLGFLVLHWLAVVLVMVAHIIFFGIQIHWRGEDINHFEPDFLRSPRPFPFVDPAYHLLHHKHPLSYYASMVRLFDYIAGTGCQLEGKRVLITGGSGSFGKPLQELLHKDKVASIRALKFGKDWDYGSYEIFDELLPETDILILAHGSKFDDAMAANCDSFVTIIDKMRQEVDTRTSFAEVWAVGSEIECHPHFGVEELKVYKASKDAYKRHAHAYYWDRSILYRHIVPSAFTSPMGPGLISGKMAARIAMFFIRRGFHYVPVTYTGIALLNYFSFLFDRPAPSVQEPALESEPASA